MSDTHGVNGEGWIGFDLDGTLAKYDGWQGIDHIGEPIEAIVRLAKKFHAEGKRIKILTARVSPRPHPETAKTRYPMYAGDDIGDVPEYAARWMLGMRKAGHENDQVEACAFYFKKEWTARDFIADWCLENLGFLPEIVHEKDHLMLELYDDRVKQVVPNKGILVEDLANYYESLVVGHRHGEPIFTDGWRHYTDEEIKDQANKFLIAAELPADRIDFLLNAMGFMQMPASIHHHLNYPGGLVRHSVNVTHWMLRLTDPFGCKWMKPRSPYRIGMLHDLVKCYCYRPDEQEPGKFRWMPPPFEGHGTTSVIVAMAELGIVLTPQEALCIAWHMGAFGLDKDGLKQYDAMIELHPREILLTHTADMLASKVTEERK